MKIGSFTVPGTDEDKKKKGVRPAPAPSGIIQGGGGSNSSSSSGITIGTTTITSGTGGRVLYDNAGIVGEMTTSGTGTQLALTAGPTFTGTLAGAAFTASGTIVQTSASATAFESGPNGSTNPVFRLVNNNASAATGISITGAAAGSGVTLTVLSSGSNESLNVSAKGTSDVKFSSPVTVVSSTVSLRANAPFSRYLQFANATASVEYFSFDSLADNSPVMNMQSAPAFYVYSAATRVFGVLPDNTLRLGASSDLILRRSAAANLAFGAADAASPVAQTLSVQSVVAGTTNTAGATWTHKGSASTGTGVGGALDFQVTPAGSSGSSQNTFVSAFKINGDTSIQLPSTVTAGGTTGAQTINKASGTVNFAAAATSLVVTNSLVTANSIVLCVVRTNDATATIKNVVPTSGSFTITLNAAATAETSVGFVVFNQ